MHKDIDQRRPLRVGQGRNHGVHGDLCRILPRGGELFFRGKQQLHILGAVAQQQQLAGKLRLGNGVIHQLAKAVNDIWHRHGRHDCAPGPPAAGGAGQYLYAL